MRRKNFGEMLLWAALAKEGDIFATTLGPTNRNYVAAYERWQKVAQKHHLPVRFSIGETNDWPFEAIMQSADAILSTSIAEGFGLAFLEPWLFGKAIVGRDLPPITADFKARGIRLDALYQSIPIPSAWIDCESLRQAIRQALEKAYAAYATELPPDAVERAMAAISPKPGFIDFAGLNEALQEAVIAHVTSHPDACQALPQLPRLDGSQTDTNIRSNAELIAEQYSRPHYAETLLGIYQNILVSAAESCDYLDPAVVLKGFLKPEHFRLLRS